jgi:hypothetical protein
MGDLLTVHHHPHVLDKTIHNLERLRCSYSSLILGKSVQPVEHRFDVLISKELLKKLFCMSLVR